MSPVMAHLLHDVDVIQQVRARLEDEGGLAELYALARFSVDELDLLVRLELGMAPGGACGRRYKNWSLRPLVAQTVAA